MSTATATYRRRNRIYEPVQNPTSQQGFNRYAYCLYNPLKYVDPSGYRCDDPPYWQQVQQYLTCMNRENAECLNAAGITHVQVNSSSGYSGSYVKYQVAGEWYGSHYNGYVDTGYHDGYGGQTTYSDGSLPTPPTPMYWNEGGGCGGGGTASSGGGFSKPVVPVVSKCNDGAQLGSVTSIIGTSIEHLFKKEAKLLEKTKSRADKYYYKIFSKASKIGKHIGAAGALITEGVYVKGYIDGEISGQELRIRTEINVAEFAIPWVATAVAPLIGAAAAPVLIGAGVLTIGIIVYDAFGGFDNIIYDNSIVTP